jgi:hypothetical protein
VRKLEAMATVFILQAILLSLSLGAVVQVDRAAALSDPLAFRAPPKVESVESNHGIEFKFSYPGDLYWAQGIRVYRGNSTLDLAFIGTSYGNTFTDGSARNGVWHLYEFRAFNDEGESTPVSAYARALWAAENITANRTWVDTVMDPCRSV